jgi:hypothetical protein
MRITTWTRSFALGAAAAALLGLAPQRADAASLAVTGFTLGEQVYVQTDARTGWVNTAELEIGLGSQSGFSYCVDLTQNIGISTTAAWDILDAELSPGVLRAAWLVEFARPQFGGSDATAIAALQVAIWEVLADAPGAYDLYSGEFSLREGGASAGVMNLARGFLGALESQGVDGFATSAVWARHVSLQDQLVAVNPIPEPSSLLLLAAGAGLVAFAATRKRA